MRPPQAKTPAGDHHRELCVFSFDQARDTLVLREFFAEGVVSRYTCDVKGRRIVCVTEHVENGEGLRARVTLDIKDAFQFDERFELAPAGQDYAEYVTVRWTRVPQVQ